jgi:hypothetical protein
MLGTPPKYGGYSLWHSFIGFESFQLEAKIIWGAIWEHLGVHIENLGNTFRI